MDTLEKKIFATLTDNFKLLKANWKALASNPPCQRAIDAYITEIENNLLVIQEHEKRCILYRKTCYEKRKGLCK